MNLFKKFAELFTDTNKIYNASGVIFGLSTPSGAVVTVDKALTETTVAACIRLICSNVATLPLIPYEKTERGRRKLEDLKLYSIVTKSPNKQMTAIEWKYATLAQMITYGNSFSYVEYGLDKEPRSFWLLPPAEVKMTVDTDGYPVYTYKTKTYNHSEILHFKNFSLDGIKGLSVIEQHKNKIGASLTSSNYHSNTLRNAASPSGVLTHPGILSPEAKNNIKESWIKEHSGEENAGSIVILEEGLKYEQLDMVKPADIEYIQSAKLTALQICSMFGVPAHMVNANDKPTYASVEQAAIEFLNYTIRPYLVMMEQTLNKLFFPDTTERYFQFNVNALMRTDIKTRYEAYKIAVSNGWMSVNDIRELEELNTIKNGDTYFFPLNMSPINKIAEGINE